MALTWKCFAITCIGSALADSSFASKATDIGFAFVFFWLASTDNGSYFGSAFAFVCLQLSKN